MHRSSLLLLLGLLAFWAELAPASGQRPLPPRDPRCKDSTSISLGPCEPNDKRYYWGYHYLRCNKVRAGGCVMYGEGFRTMKECQKACERFSPEDCKLPRDPGLCKGINPMYYYDSARRKCKKFNYGGCGGNANRYPSRAECKKLCGNQRTG